MPKTIAVVGAGGVGAETLKCLADRMPKSWIGASRHAPYVVRVIDRDFIDADTLKRQTLYRTADMGKLKATAASRKLGGSFQALGEHLSDDNVEALLHGADTVLDCTDNWATRVVINQWALRHRKPWIFTSAIRRETMTTTLTPKTACFVCWNRTAAVPRSCRVEGIEKATTAAAAQTQRNELQALLAGKPQLAGKLQYTDVAGKTCTTTALFKNPECPACVKKTFRLAKTQAAVLCGDGEYLFDVKAEIRPTALASLKPEKFGDVLKIRWKKGEIVAFRSGRILCRGFGKKEAEAAFEWLTQKLQA